MKSGARIRGQSSLELLITVSFALIILLPIVIIAFVQISSSSANLAVGEAQASATKLAEVAANVGAQGVPARQLVLVDIPPNIQQITIGNTIGGVGRQIIFVVSTNAGPSDAVAYVPLNVSGGNVGLSSVLSQGTYLINVSAQNPCPIGPAAPCVVIQST